MKKLLIFSAALVFGASTAYAAAAAANLKGTAEGSAIAGAANFEEADGGLKVTIDVKGVPPGKHGFHIHENGACGNEGKDAGGHFNPHGSEHGFVLKDSGHAHAGDFGNIDVAADGTGRLELTAPGLVLGDGPMNVRGKAVILHEKEDDFGQPTGNAGGRIACGIIE